VQLLVPVDLRYIKIIMNGYSIVILILHVAECDVLKSGDKEEIDNDNSDDDQQPLYIDEVDKVIKCSWCRDYRGSSLLTSTSENLHPIV